MKYLPILIITVVLVGGCSPDSALVPSDENEVTATPAESSGLFDQGIAAKDAPDASGPNVTRYEAPFVFFPPDSEAGLRYFFGADIQAFCATHPGWGLGFSSRNPEFLAGVGGYDWPLSPGLPGGLPA